MPAFLVPVNPGQMLIPLEKAVVLIGRQADCDVSLTHSRKISRKHCCIAQVNNTFVVRDLGSTNGVFVNGSRIEKEAVISMGDDLIIGDIHFRVQSDTKLAPKKKAVKNVAEHGNPVEQPVSVQPVAARNGVRDTSQSQDDPKVVEELKPVEKIVKHQTALPPVRNRPVTRPPTIDGPIAIPEGDRDFDVEVTKAQEIPAPRKARIDDVVPLNDNESDSSDEVFRLASDSF